MRATHQKGLRERAGPRAGGTGALSYCGGLVQCNACRRCRWGALRHLVPCPSCGAARDQRIFPAGSSNASRLGQRGIPTKNSRWGISGHCPRAGLVTRLRSVHRLNTSQPGIRLHLAQGVGLAELRQLGERSNVRVRHAPHKRAGVLPCLLGVLGTRNGNRALCDDPVQRHLCATRPPSGTLLKGRSWHGSLRRALFGGAGPHLCRGLASVLVAHLAHLREERLERVQFDLPSFTSSTQRAHRSERAGRSLRPPCQRSGSLMACCPWCTCRSSGPCLVFSA